MKKLLFLPLIILYGCSGKQWKGKSHFENILQVQTGMNITDVLNIMGPPDTCQNFPVDSVQQFEFIWYTPMLAAGHIYVVFNKKDSLVNHTVKGD